MLFSEAFTDKSGEVETDGNGVFRFTDLNPGLYNLVALKSGFFLKTEEVMLSDGEQRTMEPLILNMVPPSCEDFPIPHAFSLRNVAGTRAGRILSLVLDYKQRLVAGAIVTLICSNGETCGKTKTSADGWFEFSRLVPGTYAIKVELPGFYKLTVPDIKVLGGLEILYSEIYLEACHKRGCDVAQRPKNHRKKSTQICL